MIEPNILAALPGRTAEVVPPGMVKRKWFLFWGMIVMVLAVGVWFLSVSSRQTDRNQRIEKKIADLQEEKERIRRENETLRERNSYASSQDFQEYEAKEKLGMKKADEVMVVIKPGAVYDGKSGDISVEKTGISAGDGGGSSSGIGKWWKIFFGNK